MQKIEFEERTGLKLTEDGYKEVEECYMNTDLNKDTFCELWVKNPTALKEIERKTVLVRELYEERKCLSNFLIDQAEASDEFGRGCKHGMLFPLMLIMGNFTECMNYEFDAEKVKLQLKRKEAK